LSKYTIIFVLKTQIIGYYKFDITLFVRDEQTAQIIDGTSTAVFRFNERCIYVGVAKKKMGMVTRLIFGTGGFLRSKKKSPLERGGTIVPGCVSSENQLKYSQKF